jgi:hypothetical protein
MKVRQTKQFLPSLNFSTTGIRFNCSVCPFGRRNWHVLSTWQQRRRRHWNGSSNFLRTEFTKRWSFHSQLRGADTSSFRGVAADVTPRLTFVSRPAAVRFFTEGHSLWCLEQVTKISCISPSGWSIWDPGIIPRRMVNGAGERRTSHIWEWSSPQPSKSSRSDGVHQ